MTDILESGLKDAGCSRDLIDRYRALEDAGDKNGCLNLLRKHRCELVCALHEAQRPIDVCDWMIRDLERAVASM